jgi:hypothetical protein
MPTADFFHRYLYALAEIHASFDLEATQNAVVRNAVMLFGARGASLMLFNPNEESLIASAIFGLSDAYRAKGTVSPRKSLGETIDGAPVVIRDVTSDPRVQYPEAGLPLSGGSALVGALRLYFAQAKGFSPEEMESLQALTHQAGLALKKAFYFASMKAAVSEIQRMPSTDFKEAMQSLLATVAKYGLARGSGLLLLDRKTNTLSTVVRYGLSDSYLAKGPVFAGLSRACAGHPGAARPNRRRDRRRLAAVLPLRVRARTGLHHVDGAPRTSSGHRPGENRVDDQAQGTSQLVRRGSQGSGALSGSKKIGPIEPIGPILFKAQAPPTCAFSEK